VEFEKAEGVINVTMEDGFYSSFEIKTGTRFTEEFEAKHGKLTEDGTASYDLTMWRADNPLKKSTYTTTAKLAA
jgi:hypothetical protein